MGLDYRIDDMRSTAVCEPDFIYSGPRCPSWVIRCHYLDWARAKSAPHGHVRAVKKSAACGWILKIQSKAHSLVPRTEPGVTLPGRGVRAPLASASGVWCLRWLGDATRSQEALYFSFFFFSLQFSCLGGHVGRGKNPSRGFTRLADDDVSQIRQAGMAWLAAFSQRGRQA